MFFKRVRLKRIKISTKKQTIKMSIFVIGAKGFIGANLVRAAEEKGHVIGTSSKEDSGYLFLDLANLKNFNFDVFSPEDVVFVTSAISAPDICENDYNYAYNVNVSGTKQLIRGAIGRGSRVIFFSSDVVYGENLDSFDESEMTRASGAYAKMKQVVEREFEGVSSFKTIRLSYVFSLDDKFTCYLRSCAKNGRAAELYEPFQRSIVCRADVVDAALNLARDWEKYPETIINFGGSQLVSRVELCKVIKEKILPDLDFKVVEPPSNFFLNRPRIINMRSPILPRLLGRQPTGVADALIKENSKNYE